MKVYSEYSWLWVFLCVIFATLITFIQYYFKVKNSVFSRSIRFLLAFTRGLIILIICILLLNFYSKFTKNEYVRPVLIICVDNSQSMISAKDSNDVKKFFSERFRNLKQLLSDKIDIQILTFGEKIRLNQDSILFNESVTNPENIFNETQQVFGNKPISAMLMITDGIFNEGVHPVSLADNIQYPVYVLATGDTTIYKDIKIKKILCNKNVFPGNDFIAEILIHSTAVKNENTKISIYEGNKQIAEKIIQVNSEKEDVTSVLFQLNAQKSGYHTYKVTISPLEKEKNIQNNTSYFVVNVIENKIKVLVLYSAPHPDISAIKQVLARSPQYDVEMANDEIFTREVEKYDVILYHSPAPTSSLFHRCYKSSVSMFIINAPLSTLQDKFLNIKQSGIAQYNESESVLNSSFSLFSITDEYKEMSEQLPIVLTPYGNYYPIGTYDILFHQKINNILTDLPLFYFTQTPYGKYALFLGDGLWRWKMTNYQLKQNTEWFNHLILQTIRYLSVKRDKNPFKVHIPGAINQNEPLQITAEFYNESMQSITDPDVFLKLKDTNNYEYKFVFNKSSSNYFLNAGILPPGEYEYVAYTQYNGKEYQQSGKIHIVPVSVEKNNLVAQHQLLKILANKTNGKFYYLHDTEQLIKDISENNDIKTIVTQNETYQYWIDNKWWFFILIMLAISEWFIRRWNGVI